VPAPNRTRFPNCPVRPSPYHRFIPQNRPDPIKPSHRSGRCSLQGPLHRVGPNREAFMSARNIGAFQAALIAATIAAFGQSPLWAGGGKPRAAPGAPAHPAPTQAAPALLNIQTTAHLTLDEAKQRAMSNSKALHLAAMNIEGKEFGVRAAQA